MRKKVAQRQSEAALVAMLHKAFGRVQECLEALDTADARAAGVTHWRIAQFAVEGTEDMIRKGSAGECALVGIVNLVEQEKTRLAEATERRHYPDGKLAGFADLIESRLRTKNWTPEFAMFVAVQALLSVHVFEKQPPASLFDLCGGPCLNRRNRVPVNMKIPRRHDGEAFVRAAARYLGMSAVKAHHLFDVRDKRVKREVKRERRDNCRRASDPAAVELRILK